MKLSEAYETLGLPRNTILDEVKKQYKLLVKQWHPDTNKSAEADEKIKLINEAYECVKSGKGNDREVSPHQNWSSNPWHQQRVIQLEVVELRLTIDFKESILGCKKEIKYIRQSKCQECSGAGEIRLNNGCKKCGGNGRVAVKQRGMVFISTCTECYGKSETVECDACKGNGTVHTDVAIHVSVPAGIMSGNTLRLQGMGNYAGTFMGVSDQYTDAFCHITVTPDHGLSLEGKDVVFTITISLLDALKGHECTVKTIFGDKQIKIKPQSRNRDEVIIPNLGVNGVGNQRVILDVQYPPDIDKLIGALTDGNIMAVSLICNNSYTDANGKQKKCGQMDPYMDPKTEKVYCSLCDNEIINITHFMKITMKTLKQFRQKPQVPFGVKCQNCGKEAQPKILGDDIVCPGCSKPHGHLSEPFKIMLKDKLKTTNKDV